jgi:hypothetical protein
VLGGVLVQFVIGGGRLSLPFGVLLELLGLLSASRCRCRGRGARGTRRRAHGGTRTLCDGFNMLHESLCESRKRDVFGEVQAGSRNRLLRELARACRLWLRAGRRHRREDLAADATILWLVLWLLC